MNNHCLRIKKTQIQLESETDPEKETTRLDISQLGQGTSRLIACIGQLGPNAGQLL